jgi:hypothetical protein
MSKMKNQPRKQERRRKERRPKRTKSEDERSGNLPASAQWDRDEDAPRPPMTSGKDDDEVHDSSRPGDASSQVPSREVLS